MSNTVIPSIPVTRDLKSRIQIKHTSKGVFTVLDATGQVLATTTLPVGGNILVTYTLASSNHCGAAIVQPLGWRNGCRAELSHMLGSVDFPYLAGTGYRPWPQTQRHNSVTLKFTQTDTTQGTLETAIGPAGEQYATKCDICPSPDANKAGAEDGITALLIGFTERGLPSGGTVTFTGFKDAAGAPIPVQINLG